MDCFICDMFVISPMVTTKEKSGVDLQSTKNGETEHTTMRNQFAKAGRNRRKRKQWRYKPTRRQTIR